MSSDNILAILTGALEQTQRSADMVLQDALQRRRRKQEIAEEMALYPQKLAMQTQAKQAESAIDLQRQRQIEQEKYNISLPLELQKLDVQRSKISAAKSISEQRAKDKSGQVPAAQIGHYTLAQESMRNIDDVKKILFPKGTPESFNRGAAVKSNIPGSNLPIIGNVIPDVMPWSKEGQDIYRQIGEALAAKQLIKTGVAARPDETRAMTKRFMAGIESNPESAFSALNELGEFYQNYISNLKTKGTADVEFTSSQVDDDPLGLLSE